MYWPTTTARRLHLSPAGLHGDHITARTEDVVEVQAIGAPLDADADNKRAEVRGDEAAAGPSTPRLTSNNASSAPSSPLSERIVHVARSRHGHLWAALTADTLSIWSVRPAQTLAALVRTPKSIVEYGANVRLHWNTNGRGIVVETSQNYLLLYTLHALPPRHSQIYSYIPSTGSGARSRSTKEPLAPSLASLRTSFTPGPGEGQGTAAEELQGSSVNSAVGLGDGRHLALDIRFHLVLRIDAGLSAILCTDDYLIVFTKAPPAVQCIPWPDDGSLDAGERPKRTTRTTLVERLDWILTSGLEDHVQTPFVTAASYSEHLNLYVFISSDGRAYSAQLEMDTRTAIWRGKCFHGAPRKAPKSVVSDVSNSLILEADADASKDAIHSLTTEEQAITISINARFSLLAVGLRNGVVQVYTYRAPDRTAPLSHELSIRKALRSTASYLTTGPCTCLAWTSDGHALAVGWETGWSVWSTFGKLMGCSLIENWHDASARFSDSFMQGVSDLFWSPGNTDLFFSSSAISNPDISFDPDKQLFALPFAKSAVAGQHSPDNTRYAFVQLDDSVLVYRGSDQPDMSIINPESDVWHNIKIPTSYLASNWPIRYACISSDGRLMAVAGRRGLTHFSTLSGRWKEHHHLLQEQSFSVQGGLQWYQHVLVAACHVPATEEYQIRLYSRDANLDDASILYIEQLPAAVVLTSLFDNSLLVYTADNTLHHYLIAILEKEIRLTLCGSITFEGVVGEPDRVRGMSWLVPYSQQRFGDPMDDLMVATIIFLIDGKLVLLRPRRGRGDDDEEVSYDMQILGDRIEYYWTHLQGVGTLENSLWGYDGHGIKLWLDALTIEQADVINDDEDDDDKPEYRTIAESLSIPLDFYPLCVLIEKGIIIGVEPEVSLRRSLDFAIFRSTTITKLFLQQILRNYLERAQLKEAVLFASFYKPLAYFSHSLEILLHDVLEDEADALSPSILPKSSSQGSIVEHVTPSSSFQGLPESVTSPAGSQCYSLTSSGSKREEISTQKDARMPYVVAFLDHFDESLEVVVNCARKTEIARWHYLFSFVGQPRDLFELCLVAGNYKTAGSYLLVLHNLEPLEESHRQTVRLFKLAREHDWNNLCKDLLRFSRSLDEDGRALRRVIKDAGLQATPGLTTSESPSASSAPNGKGQKNLMPPTPHASLPSFHRTASAPNVLDVAIEEEEGEEALESHRIEHAPGMTQRSYSLFTRRASANTSPPPVPSLGVNGRILSSSPSATDKPRTLSASSASAAHHSTQDSRVWQTDSTRRSGRGHSGSGLGMSLSRVGLRPSDKI